MMMRPTLGRECRRALQEACDAYGREETDHDDATLERDMVIAGVMSVLIAVKFYRPRNN
jgi:hypothetical protein